jgi:hypothetical protein
MTRSPPPEEVERRRLGAPSAPSPGRAGSSPDRAPRSSNPEPSTAWADPGPEQGWSADDGPHIRSTCVSAVVHDQDRETVGYIGMAEWDDEPRETALTAAAEAPGPAVVLRSSPPSRGESEPSWHLWLPTVRPWERTVEIVRAAEPAEHYLSDRLDAGEFWLRTRAKFFESGSITASPPIPMVVVGGDDGPLSRPHLLRLRQLAEAVGHPDASEHVSEEIGALLDRETVGATYDRSHYRYDRETGGNDG